MAKDICVKLKFDSNGQTVMGQLTVSAKELQAAMRSMQRQTASSFSKFIAGAGAAVNAMRGAIDGVSGLAQPYMAFDQAMRTANTMAGKGAKDFEQLKDKVKALSKEVPVARDALANGLYQVISNGVPESNWMSFLEQSAKSSVGGVADLGEVVKVTSTVIKNYGLSWEDAGRVQDMIQLTAKNGVTSFEQLAQALPRVTTNAAKLGISTAELMASFSTLTGVTGNTNEVSTQLAAVLTALVKPSSEAQKMAKAMGIEFNAASIKSAGGLQDFLVILDQAVQNYASANNVLADEVYGKLFGSAESLRALGALTGQLSDKYQENVAAMQDASGTIEAAFEEMAGSGQNASQKLKNSFDSMTDSIGEVATAIYPAIQYTANLGMAMSGVVAIGKVLKVTMGGLTAACMQYKAVQKSIIALEKMTITVKRLMVAATQSAVAAKKNAATATNVFSKSLYRLKAIIMSHPIGLLATAVATLVSYLCMAEDETEKLSRQIGKIQAEYGETAKKSKERFVELVEIAKTSANGSKRQKDALDKLNQSYSDILGNEAIEIKNLRQMTDGYEELTKKIDQYHQKRKDEEILTATKASWAQRIEDAKGPMRSYLEALGATDEEIENALLEIRERIEIGGEKATEVTKDVLGRFEKEWGKLNARQIKAGAGAFTNVVAGSIKSGWNWLENADFGYLERYGQAIENMGRSIDGIEERIAANATGMGKYAKEVDEATRALSNFDFTSREAFDASKADYNNMHPSRPLSWDGLWDNVDYDPTKANGSLARKIEESNVKIAGIYQRVKDILSQEGIEAAQNFYEGMASVVNGNKTLSFIDFNAILGIAGLSDEAKEALGAYNSMYGGIVSNVPVTAVHPRNNLTDLLNDKGKDKDTDKTLKQKLEAQLSAAKERYVKASMAGNESEAAGIKTVIDGLRQQISQIELIEKMAERPATLTTLEDINAEIQYQQALRQQASDENIKAIDAEIERLEKLRQAKEDASYTVKSVEEIKTYEDLEKARQYYQNKMKTASEAERIEIQKNINKIDELEEKWNEALAELKAPGDLASLKTYEDLEKAQQYYQNKMKTASEAERIEIQKIINQLEELREKWDEALAELKAPGDLASLDTLEKMSKALSYYQAQLEKASPDEIPGLVKKMEGIKEAQVLAQRPVTIATARYETDRISGLDKKTKKQKIRGIGYDELTDKIAALQAMLDDTEHPLLESQRDEVMELIEIYSQWQKLSVDTWGAVTQGISASASMLSNLGGIVKGAAAEWLSSIGQIMESLAKLIPLLLTVTGIKAMESAAETPIVGWLMVGAAAAAVIAAFATLPKFANGGIAYGPTIGMFGEYPGVSNNPEVVAPLNKLRSLIEPAGMAGGKVDFEIEGTKLKGVLARVEKRSSRS